MSRLARPRRSICARRGLRASDSRFVIVYPHAEELRVTEFASSAVTISRLVEECGGQHAHLRNWMQRCVSGDYYPGIRMFVFCPRGTSVRSLERSKR